MAHQGITNPQYITDQSGHRTGVILPIKEYTALLEDLADLAVAAERSSEPTLTHSEVVSDLRNGGYLPS